MTSTVARTDEAGTVTVWMLGLCVVVLFLGGLSLDLWRAFTERRDLAAAVDAAAVAGASAIDVASFRYGGVVELDTGAATTAACAYLRQHTSPPISCAGIVASPQGVEVVATRQVPLTLTRVLLPDESELTIRARARVEPHRVE